MTSKLLGTVAAVAALAAVAATVTWAVTRGDSRATAYGMGSGMMGYADEDVADRYFGGMMGSDFGSGMMGYGGDGAGPVSSLAGARSRAQAFADQLGLRAGEVMQFTNHYYVELVDQSGRPATEVLVSPRTGRVWLEPGPAMMWNTDYGMGGGSGGMMGGGFGGMMGGGMMGGGYGGMMGGDWIDSAVGAEAEISPQEAVEIASRWLSQRRPGLVAGEAEAFPGYYTLHILRDGRVAGMLSVHASTGAVWYHSWHGRFVAMTE